MSRLLSMTLAASYLVIVVPAWAAEEAQTAVEIRELRQALQQQSKHIEVLAEQVARLTRLIDVRSTEALAPTVLAPTSETAKPPAEPAPEAPKAELVVKAEPVVTGVKHVVTKGETLTSIAKQYNIPLGELKNANKIENDRKLQIGQILTVPTAKNPEPEKKE